MISRTTAAAIIAGGHARRFGGQDKGRLVVEGRPIIVRQMEILQQVAGAIFIVGHDAARFADLGVPVYADIVPDAGALGGIYTALSVATGDPVLTIACDMPFLEAGLLLRLIERSSGFDAAWVRSDRGVEPLVACYRKSAGAIVGGEIASGRLKAGDLGHVLRIAELGMADVAEFGPPARVLANVNTPADYARVQYSAE
jgi:molybdopterin-guanine dinucleotide biosynthesis protein A